MCPSVFDRHVSALDVTGVTQASVKSREKLACQFERCEVEKPDHRHRRLLRARPERPRRRRAAEQRDELAPLDDLIELHSIPEPGPDRRISNWRRIVSGF